MKLVFHALLWLGVVNFATGHPVDIACAGLDKCGGLGTEHAGTAIVSITISSVSKIENCTAENLRSFPAG